MFIAYNNDLITEIANTEEELLQKLKGRIYTSIEETSTTYVMYNGEVITQAEAEEREAAAEAARKAKLKMTKRDFFLYVLQPFGVTYAAMMTVLSSNDTLLACYEGCNHIYRYDAMLVGNIKNILESITGQEINKQQLMATLDAVFEEHNATD